MSDLFVVLVFAVIGLLAHAAARRRWLEMILRAGIVLSTAGEGLILESQANLGWLLEPWTENILIFCCAASVALLLAIRKLFSVVFTALEIFFSGQLFIALYKRFKKQQMVGRDLFERERIFVPTSVPHMVGLFLYLSTVCYLLSLTDPNNFHMPSLPVPLPLPVDQLVAYNGVGLVLLSFCAVGIFVARRPRQCLSRLGWAKPTGKQVGIGVALIAFSFIYDALWAILTHNLSGQDLASKLSNYNADTFSVLGGFTPSVVLALATALCAGIGEETLIRGALQPVFGIFPAALLHGMLHGQFTHAPIFLVQIALWSTFIGFVRRYTNTTTTIIGHAGFNFITTFLFAFNP